MSFIDSTANVVIYSSGFESLNYSDVDVRLIGTRIASSQSVFLFS